MKPGKEPSNPSSYRPIALASLKCKIMEQMIHILIQKLEKGWYFLQYQCGWGDEDEVVNYGGYPKPGYLSKKAIVSKEAVVVVFLDIEKAMEGGLTDSTLRCSN